VRRLLTDLDDDEFASLGRLVNIVMELDIARAVPSIELQYFPADRPEAKRSPGQVERVLTYYRPSAAAHMAATGARLQRVAIEHSPPLLLRIFHLLKVNDLAFEPRAAPGFEAYAGGEGIVLDFATLKRLDRVLRPGRSGQPVPEPSKRAAH
jgi:hypothetical protein